MNGFRLHNREACERIIRDPDVYLEAKRTGVHYQISKYHSGDCYRFSRMMGLGSKREQLGQRLINEIGSCDLDTQEITALIATGIDAALLVGTLQHFREFENARLAYVCKEGDTLKLREGFSFYRDEKVFLIHTAGVTYNRVADTIRLIFDSSGGKDPCIEGFAVLFDRSPAGSLWRQRFPTYKVAVGIGSPIIPYAGPLVCPYCRDGLGLIETIESA